jgi:crotonobetainyl-CoA:carnitine CoA-transferase CaiB-like acyl-CoA transferase
MRKKSIIISNPRSAHFFESVLHPEAGYHSHPGLPMKFSKTPSTTRMPAPCLGEHNEYVYGKLLGLTKAEID